MAANDPAVRRMIARLGGHATAARGARTAPAYQARWAKYLDTVDAAADAAGEVLSEAQRESRAKHLLDADMVRLSMRAAEARVAKRRAREEAARKARDGA